MSSYIQNDADAHKPPAQASIHSDAAAVAVQTDDHQPGEMFIERLVIRWSYISSALSRSHRSAMQTVEKVWKVSPAFRPKFGGRHDRSVLAADLRADNSRALIPTVASKVTSFRHLDDRLTAHYPVLARRFRVLSSIVLRVGHLLARRSAWQLGRRFDSGSNETSQPARSIFGGVPGGPGRSVIVTTAGTGLSQLAANGRSTFASHTERR